MESGRELWGYFVLVSSAFDFASWRASYRCHVYTYVQSMYSVPLRRCRITPRVCEVIALVVGNAELSMKANSRQPGSAFQSPFIRPQYPTVSSATNPYTWKLSFCRSSLRACEKGRQRCKPCFFPPPTRPNPMYSTPCPGKDHQLGLQRRYGDSEPSQRLVSHDCVRKPY